MRAVVIIAPGGPEVLEIREVDAPKSPTAARVRVRVQAAGMNRADIIQRQSMLRYGIRVNLWPGIRFLITARWFSRDGSILHTSRDSVCSDR